MNEDFENIPHLSKRQMGNPKRRKNRQLLIYLLLIIITIIATLIISDRLSSEITPENQLSDKEIESVLEKMADNVLLPNEEPIVAKIADAESLKEQQSFYKDTENGQYLILFPENARAFLYDFEKDLIINAGPLQITNSNAGGDTTQQDSDSGANLEESSSDEEETLEIDPVFNEDFDNENTEGGENIE